ncbi:Flp pilus assembly protein CpaB [Achromobacter spanius]|uniref:Flp pilus assembly protein CpaB n=1 Tax=Achromobacter spanius TaxID=217203 RepID=UPI00222643C0|nr:Flp pilus assembly protein CpaB [Achromobacter spanius]MCW3155688.1 Flp pilus assembly protein CpaB [Achromobacter spanius]
MKAALISGVSRLRRAGVYGLALMAGLLSAWAVREHVQQRVAALEAEARTPVVERLVAAYDLVAGTRLEEADVAIREIPVQWASSASLEPLALSNLLGGTLMADVAHGEPLLKSHLTFAMPAPALASRLRSGQRALTVAAADLGGLAEMLHAGDSIDIYVTFPHRQKELTVPLLQGMRVLTVGGGADDEGGASGVGSITLAADPDQAMKFVAARQAGSLTAMLRHRDDEAAVAGSAQTDLASLIGLVPEPEPAPGVAILYGDRMPVQSPVPSDSAAMAGIASERP